MFSYLNLKNPPLTSGKFQNENQSGGHTTDSQQEKSKVKLLQTESVLQALNVHALVVVVESTRLEIGRVTFPFERQSECVSP